ncbi:uncharacterized protein LOC122538533 [Frieseomelitta varia]|uniref:uncharacterized protein LOC122538533 n=1 Tax=Frieseomelitta varia TaxID=561572 RepID=UPI001CB67F2D|nr:uncharacterized protein LOC122538533 [Frieseomelitta varia]
MEHRCLRIFLLLAVLDTTAFIAASENQTDLTRIIKEGANNPLFELRHHDLSSVLQPLQLFATPAEKEGNKEDETMNVASKSSLLSKREAEDVSWKVSETESVSETEVETTSSENDSCETIALNYGHRHKVGTMVHEYFCEMNKIVGYAVSIAQDLKPGSPLVVALNVTEDVFSFTELALDGDLSRLVETVVIRFEEFLKHPENLKKLMTIVKKDLRLVMPIVRSVIKLTKSIKKFEDHVRHLFAYFQADFRHMLKKFESNVVIFSKKALSLFYGYVLNPVEEIAGLVFEAVTWVETMADNLISYTRRKLYRHLAFFEEGIDILQAFFSGFSASGFSQTFIEILQLLGMSETVTTSEESSTNVTMSESSSQSIASGLVLDE